MLELQNQPGLEGTGLDDQLEELDVNAWDRAEVGEILRVIANRASPDAQVDEMTLNPLERPDEMFRVVYAPAFVLRERRPTAYEELINRFQKDTDRESFLATTGPWERFLREGQPSGVSAGGSVDERDNNLGLGEADCRFYFPLPTNEEQRRIAERLRVQPFVLVKGPPGTGKSHTIANLISHLLASGERVLVTAHAPKALAVLRDLLPGDIRNLCVTAFGSTREDQRLLEDSVRGILQQKNEWRGEKWAQKSIAELEHELRQLEDKVAQVERNLRTCRESETHSHTLPGGYQGTAAQIARKGEAERETHGWFLQLPDGQNRCPLQSADIALLAHVHSRLTEERLSELRLNIGNFLLPDPKAFEEAIAKQKAAEGAVQAAQKGLSPAQLDTLQPFADGVLHASKAFLNDVEEHTTRSSRVLGDVTDAIVKDLIVGQQARWDRLAQTVGAVLKSIDAARKRLGSAKIDLRLDILHTQLLADARERLDHLHRGGHRGLWLFAPRVMRDTRYIEKGCRVDGRVPRDQQHLEKLVAFLEMKTGVKEFSRTWPVAISPGHPDPRQAAAHAEDLARELNRLLELFRNRFAETLSLVPINERMELSQTSGRKKWLALIEAEMAHRSAVRAREALESLLASLHQIISTGNAHPCIQELARAVEERDPKKWLSGWDTRERLRLDQEGLRRYEHLLDQLDEACPGLGALLSSSQSDPVWKNRLLQLEKAWAWAAARGWLRRVTDPDTYPRLVEERHRLQDRIEKTVEKLAGLRAWHSFFARLDDLTEQNLTAWTRALARIGKGTGKYAYRHRRTARQYLMACIPKIPAWIMPLHKLWETTDPTPGVFDTVIVDEASQAGIEALVLLLLAKRIIVVGDDKQNSPEAVGVLEHDIARLARDHLHEFRFRDEFRPDTSLFDHAERAFPNLISLREHFRCVPEIIRFSNDLCYTDAPLIPLRQPPPDRLPPLRPIFVDRGACGGEGQRIMNRAEAEAIVKTIQACLDDEAYEGKTMGVIVLQGHAQGELIEKKLAEVLEPKVREERRVRCGVPATFQGDQRDVIFLSLVVAPNYHFRALTGLPDQRRFNVAMSQWCSDLNSGRVPYGRSNC
jgi:hypothetical protein